jgi:hypothetical protein
MFEKGDKYIHFTKYGGINKGFVKSYHKGTFVIDTQNQISYYKPYIITNNNTRLELDGSDGKIYKINQEYTKEQSEKLAERFKSMSERKSFIAEKLINEKQQWKISL